MFEKFKHLSIDIAIFVGYYVLSTILIILFMTNGIKNYNLANLIAYFFVLLLFFIIYKKELLSYMKDFKTNHKKYFPKYLYMGILGILIMNALSTTIGLMVGGVSNNESLVRSTFEGTNIVVLFLNIGIFAPVCEEIAFRLTFKNLFKNKYMFSIIMGLFFAFMHMIGTTSIIEWVYIIPYFVMGYALSYIFFDSNNLINSIIVHCFNNIITLLLLLMVGI